MKNMIGVLALAVCAVMLAGLGAAVPAYAAQGPVATPYVPSVLTKTPQEMEALLGLGSGAPNDGGGEVPTEEDAAEELERILNEKQYYFNSLLPGQPAPYTLEVDVVNQVVSAYGLDSDGLYTVLERQMICSTGKKSTPTLLGKFVMPGERRDRHEWAFFSEFNVYAQYTSRIYKGYLFHSVLYNRRNENSLITSSVRNLGKRASHGCIRLQVKDAKWIYENCPPGTVVHVFDDAPADPELNKRLKAEVSKTQKLGE